jgi:hypothetical protein
MRAKQAPAPGLYALIFTVLWGMHAPLLRLPYFWDEAGYYVPAARDLWLRGDPVPISTLSNAHPPLVMAWLAFWWKFSAYTPAVTRTAMLLVAAFALLGVFRLARQVSNLSVAVAATLLTALYPPFFAQSSLVHLDMTAAAFTLWGLASYLRRHHWRAMLWFALAGLAKETALIAPAALILWQTLAAGRWWLASHGRARQVGRLPLPNVDDAKEAAEPGTRKAEPGTGILFRPTANDRRPTTALVVLALSSLPLLFWYAYHYARTGVIFGNPEYLRYNLGATLKPWRIFFALGQRCWQLFGYLNMFVLTGAAALALRFAPLPEPEPEMEMETAEANDPSLLGRQPMAGFVRRNFAVIILAYLVALSVVGGAVLARYLLPVYPLVILLAVETLWRRVAWWKAGVAMVAVAFVVGLFASPMYRIAPEDSLAYVDFVRLHKRAATELSAKPGVRVLTAWPASDELRKPYLGYLSHPVTVIPVENFTPENLRDAAQRWRGAFDYALVFSTKYDPPGEFRSQWWEGVQTKYFDYHRDAPPQEAARILGGRIVYYERRGGEWLAIIAPGIAPGINP